MAGRVPSRGSDQFNLRFPQGMRSLIAEAAEASGRSMNAEIIQRLIESFAIASFHSSPGKNDLMQANIKLDTDGLPISWDEIHVHLKQFLSSKAVALHVTVVTPELVPSERRQKEVSALSERYKKSSKKPDQH